MRADRKNRIATAVLCGDSYEAVAAREKLSPRRVREICAAAGLSPAKVKDVRQRAVASAIAEGKTRAEVEEKFGVRLGFIQEACEKHGIAFEPFGLRTDRTFAILRDLLNTNLTHTVIAAKHGVSAATISDLQSQALLYELPIQPRRTGAHLPRRTLRAAICFDEYLTENPEVYREIIGNLRDVAEIIIVGRSETGGEREIFTRLHGLGIGFDRLVITDDYAATIEAEGVRILIASNDDEICCLDQRVVVLKARDCKNFDFDERLWIYDSLTGASVDG